MRSTTLFALPLALFATAFAGGAGQPQAAPLKLSQEAHVYQCQGGQQVQVSYVSTGHANENSPLFAVLKYQGQRYGLAEAVSAQRLALRRARRAEHRQRPGMVGTPGRSDPQHLPGRRRPRNQHAAQVQIRALKRSHFSPVFC
ncbi:MliC family protein [Deinococcus sp. PESE-38]